MALMERGLGREGNACRATRLKLMGRSEGSAEHPPPTVATPTSSDTLTHEHTHTLNQSPLFNLGLLMTSELECQK